MTSSVWVKVKGPETSYKTIEVTQARDNEDFIWGNVLVTWLGCQSTWLWRSRTDQVQPHTTDKSKGRDMNGSEIRKEFISVRPIPETSWTSVSKTVS